MTTETDYTDDDVTRLTEMLGQVVFAEDIARRLLAKGVTLPPPPDPAVVVAEALRVAFLGYQARPFDPERFDGHVRFLAAVRDLFPTDALDAAAAKVQEAEG